MSAEKRREGVCVSPSAERGEGKSERAYLFEGSPSPTKLWWREKLAMACRLLDMQRGKRVRVRWRSPSSAVISTREGSVGPPLLKLMMVDMGCLLQEAKLEKKTRRGPMAACSAHERERERVRGGGRPGNAAERERDKVGEGLPGGGPPSMHFIFFLIKNGPPLRGGPMPCHFCFLGPLPCLQSIATLGLYVH